MASPSEGRNLDSFYMNDCQQVKSTTNHIQTLTGQISRQLNNISTDADFHNCRKMVGDAVREASDTRAVLLRIQEHQHQAQNHSEKNNRKMTYDKLSDNLAITARVLEDVLRRFKIEETKHLAGSEEMSDSIFPTSVVDAADMAGGDDQQLLGGKSSQLLFGIVDDELKKEKVLQRVDDDMRCLQRIYTDLANVADEQQQSFDILESCMAGAAGDIERGREEFSMGKYSWDHRMKQKMLYVAGAAAGVLVLVGIVASS